MNYQQQFSIFLIGLKFVAEQRCSLFMIEAVGMGYESQVFSSQYQASKCFKYIFTIINYNTMRKDRM